LGAGIYNAMPAEGCFFGVGYAQGNIRGLHRAVALHGLKFFNVVMLL